LIKTKGIDAGITTVTLPASAREEAALLRFFAAKLLGACTTLKLPRNVLATSITYLLRFYTSRSMLEYDPQLVALASLYLACKCCDSYLSAAELGRLVGAPPDALLRLELPVLQGLNFDLMVHSPYRALEGCMHDLQGLKLVTDAEKLSAIRKTAYEVADTLLLSDSPLLFPPGQQALAALVTALKGAEEHGAARKYVEHVAQHGDVAAEALEAVVTTVSKTAEEAKKSAEAVDAVAADRRLKDFRRKILGASKSKK
jgi:cyclin ccl1